MTLRDLKPDQIAQLKEACEADLKSRYPDEIGVNPIQYKLAWSDCLKTLLARLDYLPDAKS